jgi:Trehalose utilisation/Ricin-type beta-trefoil lectin domain
VTKTLRFRIVPKFGLLAALVAAGVYLAMGPAAGWSRAEAAPRPNAAPAFKVLAFYNGTWDAAHINFVREANQWFPRTAAENGFSWESTTNWGLLNANHLQQYKVIMFLDDLPPPGQRAAFQQYMQNGGAWMGFHVSAFNTNPGQWSWYHSTFLGTGAFRNNTWGPTRITMKVEDRNHPSTRALPATFRSAVSEWYSWNNDLRQNPNINILGSVDPSSFPVGTDPNQTWRSGYYPIMWTNRNYKMLYANFGHNAMNYATNQGLSSTFESEMQNRWMIDGLKWLGGADPGPNPGPTPIPTGTPPPPPEISPTAWYGVVNRGSGKCVDARSGATANGTAIQQYACNNTTAQQFQFQPTSGGYVRVNNRRDSAQALDVTGVSNADNANIQLWSYSGGNNQQWRPVAVGDGYYHLVSRHSAKCLAVPGGSTADGVQLVQLTCGSAPAQSFRLTESTGTGRTRS